MSTGLDRIIAGVAAKVFIGTFLLLLAGAPAVSWWGDGEEACMAAYSWFHTGLPLFIDGEGQQAVSVRPFLHMILCLPSAILLPLPESFESPFITLVRSVLPSFFGAGSACLFFLIMISMRVPVRIAMLLALALLFSTPLWIYSRIHYSEGLQTFLNLVLFYLLIRLEYQPGWYAILVGFLVGCLINVRPSNALIVPFVLWYAASGCRTWNLRIKMWARVGLGLVPCLVLWADFNNLRFGSPWNTGYGKFFSWQFPLTGLAGQIISPGKSIFAYAPIALLGVILFLARLFKPLDHPRISRNEMMMTAFLLINLLVFSSWYSWSGDWAWGPRHMIPFLPFLLVPIATHIAWKAPSRRLCWCIAGLACAGLIVQIPATIVGVHKLNQIFFKVDRAALEMPGSHSNYSMIFSHFVPGFSPVILQFKVLAGMFLGGGVFDLDFDSWGRQVGPYWVPGLARQVISVDIGPDLWFSMPGVTGGGQYLWFLALMMALSGAAFLISAFNQCRDHH